MADINIPHKYPLRFAKKVLKSTATTRDVLCSFEFVPTISMLLEAAAQSTAAFCDDSDQTQGMLVSAEHIELLGDISNTIYRCKIEILSPIDNYTKYSFEMLDGTTKVCFGKLLIGSN